MPSYKSSHLNLFSPDGTKKLDIDVLVDKTTISHPDKIVLDSVVDVGVHTDIASTLTDIKNDIINNFANSATASNLVQSNLDTFSAATNTTIGAIQTSIATETATRTSAISAETTARVSADTTLQSNIDSEETARTSADTTLQSNIDSEETDRITADTTETNARVAADTTITTALNVEKGRIDAILASSSIDLNSLKEIVDTYKDADNNVIKILVGLQTQISTLFSVIDTLTEGSNTPTSTDLEAVVAGLKLVSDKAWLTSPFHLVYDLTDRYDFSTSSYVGWSVLKAELIAISGGSLTSSSTDVDVKAFLDTLLSTQYGSNYVGSPGEAQLEYDDFAHYLLSVNLPSGSKPLFKGASVSTVDDVSWRLDYATTAGDDTTLYSTILSGTSNGNTLSVVPASVEAPVSGVNNVRVGYKSDVDTLTILA